MPPRRGPKDFKERTVAEAPTRGLERHPNLQNERQQLTPELSRAAKRRRLGRIVRRQAVIHAYHLNAGRQYQQYEHGQKADAADSAKYMAAIASSRESHE